MHVERYGDKRSDRTGNGRPKIGPWGPRSIIHFFASWDGSGGYGGDRDALNEIQDALLNQENDVLIGLPLPRLPHELSDREDAQRCAMHHDHCHMLYRDIQCPTKATLASKSDLRSGKVDQRTGERHSKNRSGMSPSSAILAQPRWYSIEFLWECGKVGLGGQPRRARRGSAEQEGESEWEDRTIGVGEGSISCREEARTGGKRTIETDRKFRLCRRWGWRGHRESACGSHQARRLDSSNLEPTAQLVQSRLMNPRSNGYAPRDLNLVLNRTAHLDGDATLLANLSKAEVNQVADMRVTLGGDGRDLSKLTNNHHLLPGVDTCILMPLRLRAVMSNLKIELPCWQLRVTSRLVWCLCWHGDGFGEGWAVGMVGEVPTDRVVPSSHDRAVEVSHPRSFASTDGDVDGLLVMESAKGRRFWAELGSHSCANVCCSLPGGFLDPSASPGPRLGGSDLSVAVVLKIMALLQVLFDKDGVERTYLTR
ncbi:hypothetical protein HD554DRAFT_2295827 [Boletus coccyginus]|nr:hypothetical protein HD554DRAFT_2295827 [Boletus coccyginus]